MLLTFTVPRVQCADRVCAWLVQASGDDLILTCSSIDQRRTSTAADKEHGEALRSLQLPACPSPTQVTNQTSIFCQVVCACLRMALLAGRMIFSDPK